MRYLFVFQDIMDNSAAAENDEDPENGDMVASSTNSCNSGFSSQQPHAGFAGSMMFGANIDPQLWREETERVAPLLQKGAAVASNTYNGVWNHHIDLMKSYRNDNQAKRIVQATASKAGTTGELGDSLTSMKIDISKTLISLKTAENVLNAKYPFGELSRDYSTYQVVREYVTLCVIVQH